jgi:predicted AlkP superfamily pyrophosphatase or phosphodiesterase
MAELKFSALVVLALAGLASGCREDPRHRVLLISLDGFRWDYRARFETPTLDALAAAGVSADKLQPAFPTKTFPNHFTLVTGLVPDHHGIVSNTMKEGESWFTMADRAAVVDPRWWGAEPIWTTLEKQGRTTAPLLWPGSEAPIGGVMTDHWIPYKQDLTDAERIQLVVNLYAGPESGWPDFATMYWHEVDTVGHAAGPESAEVRAAAERVDAALRQLRQRLQSMPVAPTLNVIVVSDHGMSQLSPDRIVYLEDYIDLDAVQTVDSSPNLGIEPKTMSVEQIYQALAGRHPNLKVYRKEEIPARFQYGSHPRIPPVFIMVDDGWTIMPRRTAARLTRFGNHGYDNALDSMQGLFVAAGPAFRQGVTVPRFRSVDLYELMCRILGVRPNRNDGDAAAGQALLRAGS